MLVRRSNLIVPMTDAAAVAGAWRHGADAVTLDLEGLGSRARRLVQDAIEPVSKGAAEIFVRVNRDMLGADIAEAVRPGVRGIVLSGIESAAQIAAAAALVRPLERAQKRPVESTQFIVLLETAAGIWNIRDILKASRRITQIGIDETRLAANLGIDPDAAIDPFVYARGRLAVEATAQRVAAIGMSWPLSLGPRRQTRAKVQEAATVAKNLGMKGVLCPYPQWVAPVNAAFTPTPELVEWNVRVRAAFAAGIEAGTAAVPLDGKMIDVPVDEWAKVVLEMAEACAKRDAEKNAALGK